MYYDEATAEGVRPEVAFAQTMKVTGFLQYGGDASIEQFKFRWSGYDRKRRAWKSYPDVQTGIRAQIQHLKGICHSRCPESRSVWMTDTSMSRKVPHLMSSGSGSRKIRRDSAGLQEITTGMISWE